MKAFLTLLLMLNIFNAYADEKKPSDWIDIEWDEIQGAKGYDLELSEIIDGKSYPRGVFHTDTPHWSKESAPGKYIVRIRTVDARKVPGQWGEAINLTVKMPTVQLLRPLQDEIFSSNETDELILHFQWSLTQGAKAYQVVVFNSQNKVILDEVTNQIEYKTKLNKIEDYKWAVIPLLSLNDKKDTDDIIADKNFSFKNFAIKGEALKSPVVEVEIVKNKGYVFRWPEIFRAQNYNYEIFQETAEGSITSLSKGTTNNKKLLAVAKDKVPNGKYVIAIKAVSKDFKDSETARIIVKTEKNNLEVVSNESQNRDFAKRPLEASSLEIQFGYPTVNYTSTHYETDTNTEQELQGVSFQGKWRKNISDNRYQNLLKFNFIQVSDSSSKLTYYSLSENIGKAYVFQSSRLYLAGGIRYENFPATFADRINNDVSDENYTILGPELNIQYNYHWNSHWSTELNSSLSAGLFALSSPEGGEYKPSISYELALKMIYMMNEKFDFYAGVKNINYKLDSEAMPGPGSLAVEGDVNSIDFNSTYLMFGVEFYY